MPSVDKLRRQLERARIQRRRRERYAQWLAEQTLESFVAGCRVMVRQTAKAWRELVIPIVTVRRG